MNREELIECLSDLIQTSRNSETGFQTAADQIKDPDLKALFRQASVQRAQFGAELESEVRMLSGTPKHAGPVSVAIHRGMSDEGIVAECAREENAAREIYQRVLKNNLAPSVLPVVKHQFAEIKRSHERLRDLKKVA